MKGFARGPGVACSSTEVYDVLYAQGPVDTYLPNNTFRFQLSTSDIIKYPPKMVLSGYGGLLQVHSWQKYWFSRCVWTIFNLFPKKR